MENQKRQKVVLQILPALESGGVERGTIDIAKALKKEGFEPIVVSNGGILVYQLKEAKITHIKLPVHSKNPLKIFANIKKLIAIIEEYKVDLIHARSRAPMISAYFACKKTGTKLVSTVHGTYSLKFLFWQVFKPKKFYNSMMLRADAIISVSAFIKNYLIENYQQTIHESLAKKITVIQRGAELDYFNFDKVSQNRVIEITKKWHLPDGKKVILMPARFTAWKGHEFLIEALAKVKSNFICVLVGSDHGHKKFRKKIENKIIKSNLEGKVKIVGICKDMPAAYATSNLVVCPSMRPEAFGRIAIEAQATSRIIIATKLGGSLETIIDGQTGFLVEAGDVEKFAELIDNVLNLPDQKAREIAQKGRQHIEEKFSNQKMCNDTIEVYRDVLSSALQNLD